MAAGAVSLRKSHDIVILSFCNIVKGQAKCLEEVEVKMRSEPLGKPPLTSSRPPFGPPRPPDNGDNKIAFLFLEKSVQC